MSTPIEELEKAGKFVNRQLNIAQDCSQQARSDRFAGMHRYGRSSAVRMSEKYMAAPGSVDDETGSFEGADNLSALQAGNTSHTVTC
jgi:hypothetical protein